MYGVVLLFGGWNERFMLLAAILNFLLFFGKEVWQYSFSAHLHMRAQASRFARSNVTEKSFHHCCRFCGITDKSHPKMDFRYCSKCAGDCCYCMDHLRNHEHVIAKESKL
jgi:hypothetical protein